MGAVLTRRSAFLQEERSNPKIAGEIESLLSTKSDDDEECNELSEARINKFLEHQKTVYYKSIGIEPLSAHRPQQSSMNSTVALTSPAESMIEFSSSSPDSSLISDRPQNMNDSVVEEYAMNQSDLDNSDTEENEIADILTDNPTGDASDLETVDPPVVNDANVDD